MAIDKHPDEEIYRAIAARVLLANQYMLAAGLIMRALAHSLPTPGANNVAAAEGSLTAALKKIEIDTEIDGK